MKQSEFEAVVASVRPKLVRYARTLFRCSYDEAEDLVSDVVVMALSRMEDFHAQRGLEGLQPWLTVMLQNLGARHVRDAARHDRAAGRVDTRIRVTEENRDGAQELHGAIHSLPPDLR